MPISESPQFPVSQAPDSQSPSYDFEMGQLLLKSGNPQKSLDYLKKALPLFLKSEDFNSYLSCYSLMLQASIDLGEYKMIEQLQGEVKEICRKHNLSDTVEVLAVSAYYNIYFKNDFEQAKKDLNTALKKAFDLHDNYIKTGEQLKQNIVRFHIMICLYIYSIYYIEKKEYESCIQELKNLKILLRDYLKFQKDMELDSSLTDNVQKLRNYHETLEGLKKNTHAIQKLQLSVKCAEVFIEIEHKKNYQQAEKLVWELYEEANKIKNTFFIPYILGLMASCYANFKNRKQAQIFYNLAKKNTNKERKLLTNYLENLNQKQKLDQIEESENYDIIFDVRNHRVIEKQKGCIELKNQFILIDLLELFLSNPGTAYSKEQIIQKIWKQDYLPEVHDNKIYVTIKRLRELIEVNSCKPRYICRNNIGYHCSTQAKILVKTMEDGS